MFLIIFGNMAVKMQLARKHQDPTLMNYCSVNLRRSLQPLVIFSFKEAALSIKLRYNNQVVKFKESRTLPK